MSCGFGQATHVAPVCSRDTTRLVFSLRAIFISAFFLLLLPLLPALYVRSLICKQTLLSSTSPSLPLSAQEGSATNIILFLFFSCHVPINEPKGFFHSLFFLLAVVFSFRQ